MTDKHKVAPVGAPLPEDGEIEITQEDIAVLAPAPLTQEELREAAKQLGAEWCDICRTRGDDWSNACIEERAYRNRAEAKAEAMRGALRKAAELLWGFIDDYSDEQDVLTNKTAEQIHDDLLAEAESALRGDAK